MTPATTPPPLTPSAMWRAVVLRDALQAGRFVLAVKTTGIFCRPGCPARLPRRENTEFFHTPKDAMHQGYRPCLRCQPLQARETIGPLVRKLRALIENSLDKPPVRARHLIDLGIDPATARRRFQAEVGMSFSAYQRARRMGSALAHLKHTHSTRTSSMTTGLDRARSRAGFASSSGFRDAAKRLLGESPSRALGATVLLAAWLESPLGPMIAIVHPDLGLVVLDWIDRKGLETALKRAREKFGTGKRPAIIVPGEHDVLDRVRAQLAEYFAAQRTVFDLPLAQTGTPFQQRVWELLRTIPYGETRTYAQQAKAIGKPEAVRAVALANGANYRSIVIPCHRVIGADGGLTGYGGGLDRKRWLLDHEQAHQPGDRPVHQRSRSGLFLPA